MSASSVCGTETAVVIAAPLWALLISDIIAAATAKHSNTFTGSLDSAEEASITYQNYYLRPGYISNSLRHL